MLKWKFKYLISIFFLLSWQTSWCKIKFSYFIFDIFKSIRRSTRFLWAIWRRPQTLALCFKLHSRYRSQFETSQEQVKFTKHQFMTVTTENIKRWKNRRSQNTNVSKSTRDNNLIKLLVLFTGSCWFCQMLIPLLRSTNTWTLIFLFVSRAVREQTLNLTSCNSDRTSTYT